MTAGKLGRTMRIPFGLKPAAKDYLWGGSRLNDDFSLGIEMDPFAEAWVCSTHTDGESTTYAGKSLRVVLSEHPEWLGTHALALTENKPELPILIKLIDAKENLSVQVHPNDEFAGKYENGSLGKTEMWYVLDAKPDSELIYGFNQDMIAERVREELSDGRISHYLNHVKVHRNDVFMVNPGIVHAIGAGCLIAEIQESSNLTYRLYDYDRRDRSGNKRELHIGKALSVANLRSSVSPRQPMRVLKYRNGCASELLARCKYFQVERVLLNTETRRELVGFQTGGNSFHALLCVDGCGSISSIDTDGLKLERFMFNFFKGDCIFVPAESILLKLHGKAQLLNVSC